jgi:hypothetical protein
MVILALIIRLLFVARGKMTSLVRLLARLLLPKEFSRLKLVRDWNKKKHRNEVGIMAMEFEIRKVGVEFQVFEKASGELVGKAWKIVQCNNQNLVLDMRIQASMPEGGLPLV